MALEYRESDWIRLYEITLNRLTSDEILLMPEETHPVIEQSLRDGEEIVRHFLQD